MIHIHDFKDQLLEAPDDQVDPSMKPLIEDWSNPPTALEILEVLDKMVKYGLASGFAVNILEKALHTTIAHEKTSYEALVTKAAWRNDQE